MTSEPNPIEEAIAALERLAKLGYTAGFADKEATQDAFALVERLKALRVETWYGLTYYADVPPSVAYECKKAAEAEAVMPSGDCYRVVPVLVLREPSGEEHHHPDCPSLLPPQGSLSATYACTCGARVPYEPSGEGK